MKNKKTKELAGEELDRELVLQHQEYKHTSGGKEHTSTRITKAKVGKKSFVLNGRYHDNKKISFYQRADGDLDITAVLTTEIKKRCELGHEHVVSTTVDDHYFFTLPDQTVETFCEWLQTSHFEMKAKQKSKEKEILKDCLDVLKIVESDSVVVASAIKRVTQKIHSVLKLDGYQDVEQ